MIARSDGHFEFFKLDSFGAIYGEPVKVATDTGLILQCHPLCDPDQVRHLAAIARRTRDYPVDITHWNGPEGARVCIWSARIFWRSKHYGRDSL